MRRHTFFSRNYFAHVLLIVLSFVTAGLVFYYQMRDYATAAKQAELSAVANGLAEQVALYQTMQTPNSAEFYRLSVEQLAQRSYVRLVVADSGGRVNLMANAGGLVDFDPNRRLDSMLVERLLREGEYAEVGTIDALSQSATFAVGRTVLDRQGRPAALLFVTAEDDTITAIIRHSTQTLVLILLITLIIALLLSFFISRRMTRPILEVSAAAKLFAQGNFEVRVPEGDSIIEIDELARAFNNMARDLERLEQLTRGFISGVSHELKTPMTTIGGFAKGMLDGTIAQDKRDKYLSVIAEESDRLARMVNRMLDAAKIQSGELTLTLRPTDLSALISRVILSFEKQIEKRGQTVECTIDDRLMVEADFDHLYRAVYNLVDNAVKFAGEGGALWLSAVRQDRRCCFTIVNTGITISPDDLPHVFDQFFKADKSRSQDKTGAGLGLYIVKNIINLHGGEISVSSGEGKTTFCFDLPLSGKGGR